MARRSKLQSYISHRVNITAKDGASITGTLLAFDKSMNLVVDEAKELHRSKERNLGLVVLRGETVVSLSLEPVSKLLRQPGQSHTALKSL